MIRFIGAMISAAALLAGSDPSRDPLTNEDVVRLVKAGFAQGVVVQAVRMNASGLDVSEDALASLRKAGVNEAVIAAMLQARNEPAHVRLLNPGVYYTRDGAFDLVHTEPVTWRKVSSSLVDATGWTRLSLTGNVGNSTSYLLLKKTAELLIVCDPGHSTADYQLIRAEIGDDLRQFRVEAAMRGGKLLGLSGVERDPLVINIDADFDLGVRVSLRQLQPGEYALVGLGLIADGRLAETGTMYTFAIE